jgi:DNA repair protein RadC
MTNYEQTSFSIKSWAEEDRPREKLMLKGKQSLSDAELLAILLGSGSREESAVSLSQKILNSSKNNLNELGIRTLSELQKFKGIGEAKAVTIVAAMELGRRRQLSAINERPKLRSSLDAYHLIAPMLMDLPHEEFWILCLNQTNQIFAREKVSTGGITATIVDPKIVFRRAIEKGATSIILIHNHPSGNLKPSQADLKLTEKLVLAGQLLEIRILDHLIIGGNGYLSFADEHIISQ